jgi:VHL beta domain
MCVVAGSVTMSLRSGPSKVKVLVTFISRTKRRIAVWWINFKGERVKYCELSYGNRMAIQTFESHPWVFSDVRTGDKMVTSQGEYVYWPRQGTGRTSNDVVIVIPGLFNFGAYVQLS